MANNELVIKVRSDVSNFKSGMSQVNKDIKQLNKDVIEHRFVFQGWALSIMFAGMAVQRTFSSIQKFGTKTFQDVSHSVEGMVTQTDILQGSMTYLGFSIGQALEPFIAFLIPIVERVAQWVSEHETLTAIIVASGIALGTLATFGGGLVLALNGIFEGISLLFGLNIPLWLEKTGGLVGALTKAFLFLISPIGLLILGFIAIGVWFAYLWKEAGGFLGFLSAIFKGLTRLVAVVVATLGGIVAEVVNVLKGTWNLIVGFIEGGINLIIAAVNKLTGLLGFNPIKPVDFSGSKFDTKGFGESFTGFYGDYMGDYFTAEKANEGRYSSGQTVNINIAKVESDNGSDFVNGLLRQYNVTR